MLPWDTPGFACLSSSPSSALPYLSPGRGAVIYQGYWLLTDTRMAAAGTQHSAASF